MAKKPPPPPSSSSEEEESASSDEEQQKQPINSNPSQTPTNNKDESSDESEEESSDDEQKPEPDNKTPNPSTSASAPSKSSPESESDSECDSDSDSEAAKLVIPISSKPMAEVETPVDKSLDAEKSNGKASGKPLFQRIWSLDDEIAILKAMAEFEAQHGPIKLIPSAIGEFHVFLRDSLSLKVSGTQLVEKMRRLKKKYLGLAARARKSKKELKFGKTHDQNVYELSKKVWGGGEDDDDEQVKVREKSVKENFKGGSLKREYPFLKDAVLKMRSNLLALEAIERIGAEKGRFLEKKVKKQKMVEIKHNIHEMDLLKETVNMVIEGLERSKD